MKVLSRNNNLTLECCLDIAESDKTISCSPIRKSETLWTKKKNHVFTFYLKERFYSAFGRLRISGKPFSHPIFVVFSSLPFLNCKILCNVAKFFPFLRFPPPKESYSSHVLYTYRATAHPFFSWVPASLHADVCYSISFVSRGKGMHCFSRI